MKYISILRGINVSGQKKITMDDLKSLYKSLGYTGIISYIQSGNVIFDSDERDMETLAGNIEDALKEKYSFSVPVIIRSISDWKSVIDNNPFPNIDPVEEGSRFLVTFFSHVPQQDRLDLLERFRAESERFVSGGNYGYLYCPDGYGKTKLTNNLLEKKLKVTATTRNWKTVLKLYELSSAE